MISPIPRHEILAMIDEAIAQMNSRERHLWELLRIEPARWELRPWADEYGGFWVVGLIGETVVWYNQIEGGFNTSRYITSGAIAEYWCDQSELIHVVRKLSHQLTTGEGEPKAGPPQPLSHGPGV